jgi:small subunit ribosomal protein S8
MVVKDHLSAMMNDIMNCKKANKNETIVIPATKLLLEVLKMMKKNGYIENFKVEEDKFKKIVIELGRLNKCNSIKPRFYVKKKEIYKYISRYLPSRNIGILIISTNKGLMTQHEVIEKNIGGSLLAYCY